ncbi:hypothetical protein [Photorhabdus namnaonensis]|uniref:Bacteriophage protein n=1 Tax=Photorhabdus namnaonensis TaxID=1851568 RepID=A0A1B8YJ74_9GAMM|nr:hypothetical protein [Photorhabdus namnaonensis]OCA55157.1 hypothetical protein Phpb_01775 [Photorhabdus namnaonensis]
MRDKTDIKDALENVIVFPIKEGEDLKEKIAFIYERATFCFHSGIYVNEAERQIRCKKCNQVLDPFDYLLSIAKKETKLISDIKWLREEEKQRRQNIEKLIQIERNIKARIKRAVNKEN